MKLSQKRIRALMRREGFPSVSALAEATGVNRSHIYSMWDSDTASLNEIARLARKLRASLGELVEQEPVRTLEPCERPEYRDIVAMLEAIPAPERDEFVTHITWLLKKLSGRGREVPIGGTPTSVPAPSESKAHASGYQLPRAIPDTDANADHPAGTDTDTRGDAVVDPARAG